MDGGAVVLLDANVVHEAADRCPLLPFQRCFDDLCGHRGVRHVGVHELHGAREAGCLGNGLGARVVVKVRAEHIRSAPRELKADGSSDTVRAPGDDHQLALVAERGAILPGCDRVCDRRSCCR